MKKPRPQSPFQNFLYRFDVYLSLQDKDGRMVDLSKFAEIEQEIMDAFGGLTRTPIFGNPVYDGFWQSPKTREIAKDKNSIFTVFTPQDQKSIQFFIAKKEQWRKRLDYEAILITAHEIMVI